MGLSIIRWEGRIDFEFEDWASDFVTAVFKYAIDLTMTRMAH
jgi:hypothetical protein